MTPIGEIPQSNALAEAKVDSLGELLSRDPFKYTQQDRMRVVEDLRAQRAKWERVEAAGGKAKATRAASGAKTAGTDKSAEELDL